jgi:hypothetical protein
LQLLVIGIPGWSLAPHHHWRACVISSGSSPTGICCDFLARGLSW